MEVPFVVFGTDVTVDGCVSMPSVSAALLHNVPSDLADMLHKRPRVPAVLLHQSRPLPGALLAVGSFGGVYSSLPSSPFPRHLPLRVKIADPAPLLTVGRHDGVYA